MNNDKFKTEQLMRNGQKVLLLRGTIDEDTDLEPLTKVGDPVIFNFKGVGSINSCGVRTWVNFIKGFNGKQVFYEECPPSIVRQLNMVPSFIGEAKVLSVYVPYICESCEAEDLTLVPQSQFGKVEETKVCTSCKKGEMEFDGHPEQYFAFNK